MEPDKQLLHKLKLPTNVRYAWMPESDSLREALATFIGLNKEATYCDVAEQFIDVASSFLKEVRTRRKSQLSPISRRVSLKSSDAAR